MRTELTDGWMNEDLLHRSRAYVYVDVSNCDRAKNTEHGLFPVDAENVTFCYNL